MFRSVAPVLFDLLLVYLIAGPSILRRISPRRMRVRGALKEYEHLFGRLLRFDRDVMEPERVSRLEAAAREVRQVRRSGSAEAAADYLAGLPEHAGELLPPRSGGHLREYFEVCVVVLAIVFGFRSLFLQPFKIPTGSMQPTLYGIHFEEREEPGRPSLPRRVVEYVHFSRRYTDTVITKSGYLDLDDPRAVRLARPPIPFFPTTVVRVGDTEYRLPGRPENVKQHCCPKIAQHIARRRGERGTVFFDEGEVLARGYLELGDHLFVDRVGFCYREPKRGDITVFLTDGIRDIGGSSLGGRYYIKRLVGLPGDELRIEGHRLFVKRPGEDGFRLVDEGDSSAFGRIYSFRGDYRGYCHYPGSIHLTSPADTFTVPPDCYFMLGDNSENSKDSRFWGTVPRENLVGRACVVWWPFLRRWGRTDRVEPLDFESLATKG